MKTFVLTCIFLATATAAALIPATRQRRDVSELVEPAYSYLPPEQKLSLPAEVTTEEITEAPTTTAAPVSTNLGENGYEYRTVRRLKYRFRTRRDVSHLSQHYLPPNKQYLPPTDDDSESIDAAVPKVANEYLPPAEKIASTEAPAAIETEAPFNDEEIITEAVPVDEVPQDTAILADDGYHYKQPDVMPDLKSASPVEYLPPQEEDVVEAVGPEESAVLADDGYHYRAIKRFRF